MRISLARLKRPEVPFPPMLVSRAIPGTELRVGDLYPDPGEDKRARLRAALYFEERRIVPAPPAQPPAKALESKARKPGR